MREYPDPTPVAMPITFNGKPVYQDEIKRYMEEWHLSQEEAQHVESFEEADDFEIHDDEESDFFHGITPYEMHEMPETEEAPEPPTEAVSTGGTEDPQKSTEETVANPTIPPPGEDGSGKEGVSPS